jgi:hypothetical protein
MEVLSSTRFIGESLRFLSQATGLIQMGVSQCQGISPARAAAFSVAADRDSIHGEARE